MKHLFSTLALLLLISCGTKKNQIDTTNVMHVTPQVNTVITVFKKIPYCGGARPTDDMLNRKKPIMDAFVLIDEKGNAQTVKTNEMGVLKLVLLKGKYQLKETAKNVPFSTYFLSQKTVLSTNTKMGSEACYKEWWAKNLVDFEITDTTTIFKTDCYLFSHCYTNNPCDTYTGPIRP